MEDAWGKTLKGGDGAALISKIRENIRKDDLQEFAGLNVEAIRDYDIDERRNLEDGTISHMGLPKANVMYYELENHAWLAVRPSGNEPKIKFYFGVNEKSFGDAQDKIGEMRVCINDLVERLCN